MCMHSGRELRDPKFCGSTETSYHMGYSMDGVVKKSVHQLLASELQVTKSVHRLRLPTM